MNYIQEIAVLCYIAFSLITIIMMALYILSLEIRDRDE